MGAAGISLNDEAVTLGRAQVGMRLLQQFGCPITRARRQSILGILANDDLISADGPLQVPLLFRFLGGVKELLGVAVDLLLTGSHILGFLPGFKDHGGIRQRGQEQSCEANTKNSGK